ncbi:MAG TPA: hypothetical protein VEC35_16335 [Noviherbaspirillum sp.]|nr:hypothetical protein [Noviherbaspirillum sp.]
MLKSIRTTIRNALSTLFNTSIPAVDPAKAISNPSDGEAVDLSYMKKYFEQLANERKVREAAFQAKRKARSVDAHAFISSVAYDIDGRGLHWKMRAGATPQERLQFMLAVDSLNLPFGHVEPNISYLSSSRIANAYEAFERYKESNAHAGFGASDCAHTVPAYCETCYEAGRTFQTLFSALGYNINDTAAFCLLDGMHLSSKFIEGFSNSLHSCYDEEEERFPGGEHAKRQTARRNALVAKLKEYAQTNTAPNHAELICES